ncbi:MAG: hypothetical protein KKH93_02965 [Candidatus Omnitrophica bacterium]|nr:hypothetical protein [Candidatus Omnitrophota bacterium]MBU2044685.1 hypothetical protein [Candidatus Omnitrophota bacterium]MBU2251118.1 hypothetical protein [Candidatus Omnitrophota bacterium]MBU2265425.1 hypothetical protein [Candidatus Omnitrophota bacterium]MBU2474247.1 hypothetical protein [Candidatus Omnitrophota bacterium]
MIAIIVSITIMVSLLLSAFVGFNPNFKSLVERDYLRKVLENSANYGLKKGQLISRANPSIYSNVSNELLGVRNDGIGPDADSATYVLKDRTNLTVTVNNTSISVDVGHEYAPFP